MPDYPKVIAVKRITLAEIRRFPAVGSSGLSWVNLLSTIARKDTEIVAIRLIVGGTWAGTPRYRIIVIGKLGAGLLLNPDVEEGVTLPDHWFQGANAYWSTVEYRSPTHSLQINVVGATGDWRSRPFLVAPNTLYRVLGFFKGTGAANMFLTIRWFSDKEATAFISEDNIALDATYPDWTLRSGDLTSPSNAMSADVMFRASVATTANLYGDDFFVKQVDGKVYPNETEEDVVHNMLVKFAFPIQIFEGTRYTLQFRSTSSADGAAQTLKLDQLSVIEFE